MNPEILSSRPATEALKNERKKIEHNQLFPADVYDETIAPACLYARTLKFFSCSKPSELILSEPKGVVPSGCLRRDYCPGLPLRPKTQVFSWPKPSELILRPKDDR
ncbi:unnamed protein product [Bursaphelenchus xylophilus]|nr:unnamed protein product [Bursaphelenchus xylophilus]CAG9088160.1 unnamed protein product [Bursaphelenchus xylophilus]